MSLFKMGEVSAAFNGIGSWLDRVAVEDQGGCSRQREHTTTTRRRARVRLPGISGVNTREERRNGLVNIREPGEERKERN